MYVRGPSSPGAARVVKCGGDWTGGLAQTRSAHHTTLPLSVRSGVQLIEDVAEVMQHWRHARAASERLSHLGARWRARRAAAGARRARRGVAGLLQCCGCAHTPRAASGRLSHLGSVGAKRGGVEAVRNGVACEGGRTTCRGSVNEAMPLL